jgi:DNA primase
MMTRAEMSVFMQSCWAQDLTPLYAYATERGTTEDQVRDFRLGVTTPHVTLSRHARDTLIYYDLLDGALCIPYTSPLGEIEGLTLRSLKTKTFLKIFATDRRPNQPLLLGWQQASSHIARTKHVYLTEGIFDFFVFQRLAPNTLCTSGASFSREILVMLKRLSDMGIGVTCLFDMDESGAGAYRKVSRYLQPAEVRRWTYPHKDLADFYKHVGAEAFRDFWDLMLTLG